MSFEQFAQLIAERLGTKNCNKYYKPHIVAFIHHTGSYLEEDNVLEVFMEWAKASPYLQNMKRIHPEVWGNL